MALSNSSVKRDLPLNNLQISSSLIIPRVTALLTTPTFPDGKIAFDLTTKKFYYSSGLTWLEAGVSDLIIAGETNGDVQVDEAPDNTYTISVGKKENGSGGTENLTINGGVSTGSTATGSTAYGFLAGAGSSQKDYATAVGYLAGNDNQGTGTVAIGRESGREFQASYAISMGAFAGEESQGKTAVAIGRESGQHFQGSDAIAIGRDAGKGVDGSTRQGNRSIAIGYRAGAPGGTGLAIPEEAILLGYDCAAPTDARLSLKQGLAVTGVPGAVTAGWPVQINGIDYVIPLV